MTTPKQAAARLLLSTLTEGAPHPSKRTREDMSTLLSTRISDEKREKILSFVTKIEAPFVARLQGISGDEKGEGSETPAAGENG